MSAIMGNNGEGKSSIFTALDFALFNYRKGESYKDYVRIGSEKAIVHLEADFKGKPIVYDLEVYSGTIGSHKASPVSRVVKYDGKAYYNSEYSQFLDTYNLNEVESLMFMHQGNNQLILSRPKERAGILKRIFDFQFPDVVEYLERQKESEQRLSIEYNTRVDELNKKSFDNLPLLRGVSEEGIQQMEERVKEIDDTLNKMGIANEEEITRCNSEISKTQKSIKDAQANMETDKITLERVEGLLKIANKDLENLDEEHLRSEVERLTKEIEDHNARYRVDNGLYNFYEEQLSEIRYELKDLDNHYKASKEGVCKSCGQPIEESHVKKLEESIGNARKRELETILKIDKLDFDKEDTIGKKLQKDLKFNENELNRRDSLLATKATHENRIAEIKNMMVERENALVEFESKLSILLEKKKDLEEAVRLVEKRNALLDEKKKVQESIRENRDKIARNKERVLTNQRTEEAKKERDSQVRELMDKCNDVVISQSRTKTELEIFTNGFPTFLVVKCCQKIEDYINEIVQRVFPYCRVALQPERSGVNFVYTAESSSEEWLPVSMASGAQGMVLTLAYFVALARFSGVTSIFLDEIDASCSDENSEIIYDFIAELDCFQQIFFISHKQKAHDIVKSKNESLVTYRVMQGSVIEES